MGLTQRRRDSPRSSLLRWKGLLSFLGLLSALASSLDGCASPGGALSPRLQCTVQILPQGMDVAQTTLRCAVAGAPNSDTRFTLRYASWTTAESSKPSTSPVTVRLRREQARVSRRTPSLHPNLQPTAVSRATRCQVIRRSVR
jgi:hypothetical protein